MGRPDATIADDGANMGLGEVGRSSQRLVAVGVQYAPLTFHAVLARLERTGGDPVAV